MTRRCRLGLLAAVLTAAPSAARAQACAPWPQLPPDTSELVLDLCSGEVKVARDGAWRDYTPGDARFGNAPVYLTLVNARVLGAYRIEVAGREVAMDVPQIRGLGALGSGAPGGGERGDGGGVETLGGEGPVIATPTLSVAELLTRIQSPGGAADLIAEIRREGLQLLVAVDSAGARLDDALMRISRLQALAPTVSGAQATLEAVTREASALATAASGAPRSSGQIVDLLQRGVRLQGALRAARDSLERVDPWSRLDLARRSAQSTDRLLETFAGKIERVRRALDAFATADRRYLVSSLATAKADSLLGDAEGRSDPSLLRTINQYRDFIGGLRLETTELRTEANRWQAVGTRLASTAMSPCPPAPATSPRTFPQLADARRTLDSVAVTAQSAEACLDTLVQNMYRAVQSAFDSVNARYAESRIARRVLLGQWSRNHVVSVKVSARDLFEPFRVVPVRAPGADGAAAVGDEVAEVADSSDAGGGGTREVAAGTNASDWDQTEEFSFEVHSPYRFVAVAGFAFSLVERRSWSMIPTTEQRITTRTDSAGTVEQDTTEVNRNEIGQPRDVRRRFAWAGIKTYLTGPRDAFPGSDPGVSLSLIVGMNLADPGDDWLVGLGFERFTGIDAVAGLHFGKRPVLREDLQPGSLVDASVATPPTVDESTTKAFFGVSVDANVFKAIFGHLTAQSDKVPGG